MPVRYRPTRILSLALPFLLALVIACFPDASRAEPANVSPDPDLAKHPLYSGYRFPRDGSKIHFAIQPLLAPEGTIAETMKRDAILKRKLRALGKEIVFHPFLKGADISHFARRGDIDLAMVGAVPVLLLAVTTDVQVTAITKRGSAALVAKKDCRNIRKLKGKRIGYPDGSTAYLGLLTALDAAGMKESDVRMVPMEVSDLAAALDGGRIDAFSAFEPTLSGELAAHADYNVIQRFYLPSYLYQTRAFAEREPEASRQIHASYVRSLRWLKKSDRNLAAAAGWTLEAISGMTGRKPGVTAAQLERIFRKDMMRFADSPVLGESDFRKGEFIHKSFQFLQAQGKLPPDARWDRFQSIPNRRILREILVAPASFQLGEYVPG
jgi:ABC-type taurine transport system substrate-binding protein